MNQAWRITLSSVLILSLTACITQRDYPVGVGKNADAVADGEISVMDVPAEILPADFRSEDVCVPDCGERVCGPDGCEGSCGECDDGNSCNGVETCNTKDGICESGDEPTLDDGIDCTVDACDEETGLPIHTPDDSVCLNDDWCDGVEICDVEQGCIAENVPVIDDGIDCTEDSCDEETDQVVNALRDDLCADDWSCTSDVCDPDGEGADLTTGCIVTPADVACEARDCNTAACDPKADGAEDDTGCVYTPVVDGDAPEGECGDGTPCTHDKCSLGACENPLMTLEELEDDLTECICETDENCAGLEDDKFCNGTLACLDEEKEPVEEGAKGICQVDLATVVDCAVEDDLFCNGQETCEECPDVGCDEEAAYLCVDGVAPEVDDGVDCTVDECDEDSDQVTNTPNDVFCDDGSVCTADTCTTDAGCQYVPTNQGGECIPVDVCEVNGVCLDDGNCKGTDLATIPALDGGCDDGNGCTLDACVEVELLPTCDYQPDPAGVFDDGNACTDGDYCDGMVQTPGELVDCSDGFDCTADSCDSQTGECSSVADDGLCNDDIDCTVDSCDVDTAEQASGCVNVPDDGLCADDGNDCTQAQCDPDSDGCVQVPLSGPEHECTLPDPCYADGECVDGECVGQFDDLNCGDWDHDGIANPDDLCPYAFDPFNPDENDILGADACEDLALHGGFQYNRDLNLSQDGGPSAWRRTHEPVEIPLANGIIDDSVVGYWKLDDGTAIDYSGNGNHGVVNGAVAGEGAFENTDGGMVFDGENDSVQFGNSVLSGLTAGTWSFWLATEYAGPEAHLVVQDEPGTNDGDARIILEGGKVTLGVSSPSLLSLESNAVVNTGTWHHVAVSWEAGLVAMYVDGVRDAQIAGDLTWGGEQDLVVGSNSAGTMAFFPGSIDEVIIFNRALSPDEVETYYRSSAPYGTKFVPGSQADFDDVRVTETTGDGDVNETVKRARIIGPRVHSDTPCPMGEDDGSWADRDDLCGVVAYWRLDGDAKDVTGVYDGVNDGATEGRGRFGDVGGGMEFDGNASSSVIDIPAVPDPVELMDYTVEGWVRADSLPGAATYLVDTGTTPYPSGLSIDLVMAGGTYLLRHGVAPCCDVDGVDIFYRAIAEVPLVLGTWHHYAAVRRGAVLEMYFDGIPVAWEKGAPSESNLEALTKPITLLGSDKGRLGGYAAGADGGGSYYLDGAIDEVIIHNVAKSPDYIYHRARPGVPKVRFLANTEVLNQGTEEAPSYPLRGYKMYWGDDAADAVMPFVSSLPQAPDVVADRCYGLLNGCHGYAGWWRFNEGSGEVAVDSSGWKRNAVTSDIMWSAGLESVAAKINQATQTISVPDAPGMGAFSQLNVEGLVYPEEWSADDLAANVVFSSEKQGVSEDTVRMYLRNNTYRAFGFPAAQSQVPVSSSTSVVQDWASFGMSWSGTDLSLSVMHIQEDSKEMSGQISATGAWHIGGSLEPDNQYYFNGLIDDVRVMSRGLTSDEFLHFPLVDWELEVPGDVGCDESCDDGNDVDWDGCTGGKVTEFQVNSHTASDQQNRSIAPLVDGGFVAAWVTDEGPEGQAGGSYCRVFDDSGVPLESEFKLGQGYVSGGLPFAGPDLAAFDNGGFIAVWENSLSELWAQRFDSMGDEVSEVVIANPKEDTTVRAPSVAALSSGGFVSAYQRLEGVGGVQYDDIFARAFGNDLSPMGTEFQVNTYTTKNQRYPDVAALTNDSVVVVWATLSGLDVDNPGVAGRILDSAGLPISPEFDVFDIVGQSGNLYPSVAPLAGGGFVVVWSYDIRARLYDEDGVPVGPAFVVAPGGSWDNDVATFDDGGFVVAWSSGDSDGYGVYARRFNNNGSAEGAGFDLNSFVAGDQNSVAVTTFPDGRFGFAWESDGQDGSGDGIFAKLFDHNACPGVSQECAPNCAGKADCADDGCGGSCGFFCSDTDNDGILDDGDFSGVVGDNPCTGGQVLNCDDNAPEVKNPDQADDDADGVGQVIDNCPDAFNPDQEDGDGNGVGDMCDVPAEDYDHDGIIEGDLCPYAFDPQQLDLDGDGKKDACEPLSGEFQYNRSLNLSQDGGTSKWRRTHEPVEVPLVNGILDNSVVGYWKLDGGQALDYSGNGNHGTVNGALAGEGTFGGEGGALVFDGDDLVTTPAIETSMGTGGYALMFWVKRPEVGDFPGTYHEDPFAYWKAGNGIEIYLVDADDVNSGGKDTTGQLLVTQNIVGTGGLLHTGVSVDDDLWHHVAFVRALPNTLVAYVDGRLTNSGVVEEIDFPTFAAPVRLGEHKSPSTAFHGELDEVILFNRALSPDEIETYYRSSAAYGTKFAPGAQADFDDVRVTEKTGDGDVNGDGNETVKRARIIGPRVHSDTPCPYPDGTPVQIISGIESREDLCGVVGYWKLDGDLEELLSSDVGEAADSPVASTGRFADHSGALSFDGADDGGVVWKDRDFMFNQEFTIEFWLLTSQDFDSGGRYFLSTVAGQKCNNDCGWTFSQRAYDYGEGPHRLTFESVESPPGTEIHSTTRINDGKWHHVAAVSDGSLVTLYVDGLSEGAILPLEAGDKGNPIRVMHRYQAAQSFSSGKMDELIIHSVAKSADYIYHRARPGVPKVRFLANTEVLNQGTDEAPSYPLRGYGMYWGDDAATAVMPFVSSLPQAPDVVADRCYGLLNGCHGYAGWWRFNEGSGEVAVDSSGWKRNAAAPFGANMPAWTGTEFGMGLSFDGLDDYLLGPADGDLASGARFSAEAHFKLDSLSSSGSGLGIVGKENEVGNQSSFLLYYVGSESKIGVSYENDGVVGWDSYSACDGCAQADDYIHLTSTFDSGPNLYLDWTASITNEPSGDKAIKASTTPLMIGGRHPELLHHFINATFNDVRIMNRALEADEFLHFPLVDWVMATGNWQLDCGGIVCPELDGYAATCNPQDHCEYANEDSAGWKKWDVWIYVPPGSFLMGSEGEGGKPNETPVHQVNMDYGYFISKYEIVVEQYRACNQEQPNKCTTPSTVDWNGSGWGTNYWEDGVDPNDAGNILHERLVHPQNGLMWQQAKDFCAWVAPGGRLPSEAEWEYAATGPTHRKYPWGDSPEPTCSNGTVVFNEDGGTEGYGCSQGGTWSVGSKTAGASWCGALDMGGNVTEWCQDWYHSSYTDAPDDGSAWIEPPGTNRVKRGGYFANAALDVRTAHRENVPSTHSASAGARCVRPLCIPDCVDKECGDDGCGGSCGECGEGESCLGVECLPNGVWTDPLTGLMWENAPFAGENSQTAAVAYCDDLMLAGHEDWRLPSISELRSLVRGCPNTMTGGACGVSDLCLTTGCNNDECWSCSGGGGPAAGCYWPNELVGPCNPYWSSSPVEDNNAHHWIFSYNFGNLSYDDNYDEMRVRCVRNTCIPDCEGKVCGDDGCGGSCGECGEGMEMRTIGGSDDDTLAELVVLDDGSFIAVGSTSSQGVGGYDVWLVRFDSQGEPVWKKTFGGSEDDRGSSIVAMEGGYLVGARSESEAIGGEDHWLLQVDGDGNLTWDFKFGTDGNDVLRDAIVLADGSYLVAGNRGSDTQVSVVTPDKQVVWLEVFAQGGDDSGHCALQAGDGTVFITGMGKASCDCGRVLKIDIDGNLLKEQLFDTGECDQMYNAVFALDGGLVMTGAYRGGSQGIKDAWILKASSTNLAQQWQASFGTVDEDDRGRDLTLAHSSGYVVAGYTNSYGAGGKDLWLLHVAEGGGLLASGTAGGLGDEEPAAIAARPGGDYVVVGYTDSAGAGGQDGFILLFGEEHLQDE